MELLVVVAVLVVITTLAAVDLSGLIGRYRLNAAATELVSVVKECRAKAITENQPVALVLLASDSSAGTVPWRDNVGRYEQRTGAGASGSMVWTTTANSAVDLDLGPGAQEGISIEGWTPLSGPQGFGLSDAIVFSPRGFVANEAADFPGGFIEVILRNGAAEQAERRIVLIDRGGNPRIVQGSPGSGP